MEQRQELSSGGCLYKRLNMYDGFAGLTCLLRASIEKCDEEKSIAREARCTETRYSLDYCYFGIVISKTVYHEFQLS